MGIPLPYGVVVTDGSGRITRFLEKPAWGEVVSDLVNTGIYILEPEIFSHIPEGGMPDFGKDVFPALVRSGLPVYGYETDGYWCDIGDLRAYLKAQQDLLSGRVRLPHPAGVDPAARVDPAAEIGDECWIGPGAVIGPGARVIRSA
ncbi:MAG: NDP-sugar synthase, partial [Clostridiales bacterium]|nr:NDP-sugar synthase [Clostridiales bacterium]